MGFWWLTVSWCSLVLPAPMWGQFSTSATWDDSLAGWRGTHWSVDYKQAMDRAKTRGVMLCVLFADERRPSWGDGVSLQLLGSCHARNVRRRWEVVRLPLTVRWSDRGTSRRLLDHASFHHLRDGPGLVLIDARDRNSEHFGDVVTILPADGSFATSMLDSLLSLPTGSLTQRTLILAVRTHPRQPACTEGVVHDRLQQACLDHAWLQAAWQLQGHHNWEWRFHDLKSNFPARLTVYEICAESWPGLSLWAAAQDCVHSWSQSAGHWEHVRQASDYFGLDMKLGANGIWYAAGIVARPSEAPLDTR